MQTTMIKNCAQFIKIMTCKLDSKSQNMRTQNKVRKYVRKIHNDWKHETKLMRLKHKIILV
jgi:hypothetical protein